jgi:DNA-binding CsgD family transcriptional regulator
LRAVAVADRLGLAHQRGTAYDGYARVMLRAGRPDAALEFARVAVEEFIAAGSPIDEARAREVLAEAHALRGETAGRYAQLTAAKAGYARCGATWLSRQAARTEARLAAAAPRGSRQAGRLAVALTYREREIAELASGGMTNREIAGRLHLSPKTIEAHLSRVFAKLDVHSRVELAHRLT